MVSQRQAPRRAAVGVVRTVSEEEEFLARNGGSVRSTEEFRAEPGEQTLVGGMTVTHERPGRVQMWKPMDDGRYSPRIVSESTKGLLLDMGWKIKCPQCNTNHEASPFSASDANSCPGREPVASMFCPVCGKHITDDLIAMSFEVDTTGMPGGDLVIQDESRTLTTPATRLRVQLDRHLWQFHPRSAEMMGRPPLPTPTRIYDGNQRPV